MTSAMKYRLMDLIEAIEEVNSMIHLHESNPSAHMLDQYKYKREQLVGRLIDTLVDPKIRSSRSLFLVKTILEKYYPDLKEDAAAHEDEAWGAIEAVLAS
jgi:hypothetical protein